ncbi:MAG: WD40 repeat domain-containing protein [Hyphomicrobiaceae bacterium]
MVSRVTAHQVDRIMAAPTKHIWSRVGGVRAVVLILASLAAAAIAPAVGGQSQAFAQTSTGQADADRVGALELTVSGLLTRAARELIDSGSVANIQKGMLLTLEAVPDQSAAKWVPEARVLLDRALRAPREELVLRDHTETVNSVTFSDDGKLVFSGSDDQTVRVWKADTGHLVATLSAGAKVLSVDFHGGASGHVDRIVAGLGDNTAKIWVSDEHGEWGATTTPSDTMRGHTAPVRSANFGYGGLILTSSGDRSMRVWEGDDTGQHFTSIATVSDDVADASLEPGGGERFVSVKDHSVTVWGPDRANARSYKKLFDYTDNANYSNTTYISVSFSADGKHVAVGSHKGKIEVFEIPDTGTTLTPIATKVAQTGRVTSVRFSPNGRQILTASDDGTARLWAFDASAAEDEKLALVVSLDTHGAGVTSASFSPDGKRIVTASKDKTVRVWTIAPGVVPLATPDVTVTVASLSDDSKRVVTGSPDGKTRVWEADATGPGFTLKATLSSGQTKAVRTASFNHEGTLIVTGSDDNQVRVWKADATGNWVDASAPSQTIAAHSDVVTSATFSGDGTRIVTASRDKSVQVLVGDANGQWVTSSPLAYDSPINDASILVGVAVLTANAIPHSYADIWVFGTIKATGRLNHPDSVLSARVSSDGKSIVTGAADDAVRVWMLGDQEQAISWGTGTRTAPSLTLLGHTDDVVSASFSPDSKRIVSASADGTARIWEADSTGKAFTHVATLAGHTGALTSASFFTPDGKRILTASKDGTALLWPVYETLQDLVDAAKTRAQRCLTPAERAYYYLPPTPPQWCVAKK